MTRTMDFYDTYALELIKRYDNADMSSLHKLLLKYIPQSSSVLDIGFGSGRDLQFLYDNGYDVWGIDPSAKFVVNCKDRFPTKKQQFFEASIPFDKKVLGLGKEFDAVITIAMWMHLQCEQYEDVVESIRNISKRSSTVIISYSEGSRVNDERYFKDVDLEYIIQLFSAKGFILVETITSIDSLDRDSLTWITVIFKHSNKVK